jgi:hypothetical protein
MKVLAVLCLGGELAASMCAQPHMYCTCTSDRKCAASQAISPVFLAADVMSCNVTRVHLQRRPPGDMDYCQRVGGRSPKLTRWNFDDDKV